jgi:hypothetical protein
LTAHLDAALERWKSPRFSTLTLTVLLPGIVSLPTWGKQFIDFLGFFGIRIPTEIVEVFVSQISSNNKIALGSTVAFYLLSVPTTAFLAKRGLCIGREPNRIYFPGGQDGGEVYFGERKILASVGLHAREAPIDLWILAVSLVILGISVWFLVPAALHMEYDVLRSMSLPEIMTSQSVESHALAVVPYEMTVLFSLYAIAYVIAALRRGVTGRL